MSRIQQIAMRAATAGNKLLIPYLVAGDPNLPTTVLLMHELVKQGADIIELGIPFSDPSSDGPVIQRGVERALAQGTTLQQVLAAVSEFRAEDAATAVVLMGYLNPIEIMGYQAFVNAAASAGVDGVLVVDMPPAESGELNPLLQQHGIDSIYLVAPTTSDARAREIARQTSGYLYYVSLKGVTGAALTDFAAVREKITNLRGLTDLPIVIGFGIKDAESATAMAEAADGVIIGSALVDKIASLGSQKPPSESDLTATTSFIGVVREAINNIR